MEKLDMYHQNIFLIQKLQKQHQEEQVHKEQEKFQKFNQKQHQKQQHHHLQKAKKLYNMQKLILDINMYQEVHYLQQVLTAQVLQLMYLNILEYH